MPFLHDQENNKVDRLFQVPGIWREWRETSTDSPALAFKALAEIADSLVKTEDIYDNISADVKESKIYVAADKFHYDEFYDARHGLQKFFTEVYDKLSFEERSILFLCYENPLHFVEIMDDYNIRSSRQSLEFSLKKLERAQGLETKTGFKIPGSPPGLSNFRIPIKTEDFPGLIEKFKQIIEKGGSGSKSQLMTEEEWKAANPGEEVDKSLFESGDLYIVRVDNTGKILYDADGSAVPVYKTGEIYDRLGLPTQQLDPIKSEFASSDREAEAAYRGFMYRLGYSPYSIFSEIKGNKERAELENELALITDLSKGGSFKGRDDVAAKNFEATFQRIVGKQQERLENSKYKFRQEGKPSLIDVEITRSSDSISQEMFVRNIHSQAFAVLNNNNATYKKAVRVLLESLKHVQQAKYTQIVGEKVEDRDGKLINKSVDHVFRDIMSFIEGGKNPVFVRGDEAYHKKLGLDQYNSFDDAEQQELLFGDPRVESLTADLEDIEEFIESPDNDTDLISEFPQEDQNIIIAYKENPDDPKAKDDYEKFFKGLEADLEKYTNERLDQIYLDLGRAEKDASDKEKVERIRNNPLLTDEEKQAELEKIKAEDEQVVLSAYGSQIIQQQSEIEEYVKFAASNFKSVSYPLNSNFGELEGLNFDDIEPFLAYLYQVENGQLSDTKKEYYRVCVISDKDDQQEIIEKWIQTLSSRGSAVVDYKVELQSNIAPESMALEKALRNSDSYTIGPRVTKEQIEDFVEIYNENKDSMGREAKTRDGEKIRLGSDISIPDKVQYSHDGEDYEYSFELDQAVAVFLGARVQDALPEFSDKGGNQKNAGKIGNYAGEGSDVYNAIQEAVVGSFTRFLDSKIDWVIPHFFVAEELRDPDILFLFNPKMESDMNIAKRRQRIQSFQASARQILEDGEIDESFSDYLRYTRQNIRKKLDDIDRGKNRRKVTGDRGPGGGFETGDAGLSDSMTFEKIDPRALAPDCPFKAGKKIFDQHSVSIKERVTKSIPTDDPLMKGKISFVRRKTKQIMRFNLSWVEASKDGNALRPVAPPGYEGEIPAQIYTWARLNPDNETQVLSQIRQKVYDENLDKHIDQTNEVINAKRARLNALKSYDSPEGHSSIKQELKSVGISDAKDAANIKKYIAKAIENRDIESLRDMIDPNKVASNSKNYIKKYSAEVNRAAIIAVAKYVPESHQLNVREPNIEKLIRKELAASGVKSPKDLPINVDFETDKISLDTLAFKEKYRTFELVRDIKEARDSHYVDLQDELSDAPLGRRIARAFKQRNEDFAKKKKEADDLAKKRLEAFHSILPASSNIRDPNGIIALLKRGETSITMGGDAVRRSGVSSINQLAVLLRQEKDKMFDPEFKIKHPKIDVKRGVGDYLESVAKSLEDINTVFADARGSTTKDYFNDYIEKYNIFQDLYFHELYDPMFHEEDNSPFAIRTQRGAEDVSVTSNNYEFADVLESIKDTIAKALVGCHEALAPDMIGLTDVVDDRDVRKTDSDGNVIKLDKSFVTGIDQRSKINLGRKEYEINVQILDAVSSIKDMKEDIQRLESEIEKAIANGNDKKEESLEDELQEIVARVDAINGIVKDRLASAKSIKIPVEILLTADQKIDLDKLLKKKKKREIKEENARFILIDERTGRVLTDEMIDYLRYGGAALSFQPKGRNKMETISPSYMRNRIEFVKEPKDDINDMALYVKGLLAQFPLDYNEIKAQTERDGFFMIGDKKYHQDFLEMIDYGYLVVEIRKLITKIGENNKREIPGIVSREMTLQYQGLTGKYTRRELVYFYKYSGTEIYKKTAADIRKLSKEIESEDDRAIRKYLENSLKKKIAQLSEYHKHDSYADIAMQKASQQNDGINHIVFTKSINMGFNEKYMSFMNKNNNKLYTIEFEGRPVLVRLRRDLYLISQTIEAVKNDSTIKSYDDRGVDVYRDLLYACQNPETELIDPSLGENVEPRTFFKGAKDPNKLSVLEYIKKSGADGATQENQIFIRNLLESLVMSQDEYDSIKNFNGDIRDMPATEADDYVLVQIGVKRRPVDIVFPDPITDFAGVDFDKGMNSFVYTLQGQFAASKGNLPGLKAKADSILGDIFGKITDDIKKTLDANAFKILQSDKKSLADVDSTREDEIYTRLLGDLLDRIKSQKSDKDYEEFLERSRRIIKSMSEQLSRRQEYQIFVAMSMSNPGRYLVNVSANYKEDLEKVRSAYEQYGLSVKEKNPKQKIKSFDDYIKSSATEAANDSAMETVSDALDAYEKDLIDSDDFKRDLKGNIATKLKQVKPKNVKPSPDKDEVETVVAKQTRKSKVVKRTSKRDKRKED